MKLSHLIVALTGAAVVSLPLLASAQQKADLGKREYDANCASCHGATGKGDGPLSGLMASAGIAASDLTVLAKKNNGVFPFSRVYEFIDGTQQVTAHGPREMPIWGRKFQDTIGEGTDPDEVVLGRVLTLVEYLKTIQKITPYEGIEGVGAPVMTMLRGSVVFEDGQVIGKPGQGNWLRPIDEF